MTSVTTSSVMRRRTKSRGERMTSQAESRSGSWVAIQASFAASAPASRGTPVRARLMSSPPIASVRVDASATPRRSDHKMPLPMGSPEALTGTNVCRAPEQTTTSTRPNAAGASARASAQAMTTDVHQRSGSCSSHETWGCTVVSTALAIATNPSSLHNPTLVTVVPKSMVRIITGVPAQPPGRPSRPGRGPGTRPARSPCRCPRQP